MSKVAINESTLSAIGDSIRQKTGKTDLIAPLDMPAEIESIAGGGSEPVVLDYVYSFSLCGGVRYNSFQSETCKKIINGEIILKNPTNVTTSIPSSGTVVALYGLFYALDNVSDLSNCQIVIDIDDNVINQMTQLFYNCKQLQKLPIIQYKSNSLIQVNGFGNSFFGCIRLTTSEINSFLAPINKASNCASIFYGCSCMREVPENFHRIVDKEQTNPNYAGYYGNCFTLNKINNIPVFSATKDANMFASTFNKLYNCRSITFEKNENGTPKVANWSNQTIDLASGVGFIYDGTDEDRQIINDTKDISGIKGITTSSSHGSDDDYIIANYGICKYGHDQFVETINSLPDTSAYLATGGKTGNVIKVYKYQGHYSSSSKKMNNLTSAEIAVATSKGWTISLINS